MPLTPDPYENAPDAGKGIEGNETCTNTHEGTELMTNDIATALAALLTMLTAYNREKFEQVTGGWKLARQYEYATLMLEGQKVVDHAAKAEAACPVRGDDQPAWHNGELEQFTTILCESGRPLREWVQAVESPEGTAVWIRQDDTFDGSTVCAGKPFVVVETDGDQAYDADQAVELAATLTRAAQLINGGQL
ncbi:hypothetical protein QMK17_13055 [Rhodococcus sp. G-MC3]|uniref:hypothetical protein n=1 Tax=Rhodococcus sp. G-MC3 TaxID=3046209 RepID=UPI0024B986CD|nr:hypothetical protein [Rhodococcus sp. G-MC3]MDJ0394255.1 hypothetical protein [Rhodococcus sp. G-MC3]